MTLSTLRELIAQARDELDTVDPQVVAAAVEARLGQAERLEFFTLLLPDYVRHVLVLAPGTGQETDDRTLTKRGMSPGPSKRRARALRGFYTKAVHAPEFGWAMLGDCTREMIAQVASFRHGQADAVRQAAESFEKLALVMDERDVQTVSELPEAIVRGILDGGER